MTNVAETRNRLVSRLAELRQAGAATEESRRPVELDQSAIGRLSRIDLIQDQAVAQAVEGRRRLEIRKIEAAIARIDEDEYGYCTRCGEEISQGRLDADLTTATCIKCAPGK